MSKGKKKVPGTAKLGDSGQTRGSGEKMALQEEVQAMQAEVERHDLLLQEMRTRIETARAKRPEELRATALTAKSAMRKLEGQVERDKALAKRRKLEIEEWEQWYRQQAADKQGADWAKLEYEVRWRLDEISMLEKRIAEGEQVRLQAFGEAEAVQQDLIALETGLGERPVEEDPRIEMLVQARQMALKNVQAAEAKIRRAK